MTDLEFICPRDGDRIERISEAIYRCVKCGKNYPYEHGVVRLLDKNDSFYEGVYTGQVTFTPKVDKWWAVWPLWLINSGFLWAIRKNVQSGKTIVELGCAAGVLYLGQRYRMIGCDLSYASLKKLDGIYEKLVQADASTCLPMRENSVDAIVSSFFWEHITEPNKRQILSECRRVLRPGGKIIFLYDVETDNPLIKYFKMNNPTLYDKVFIDGDAHVGYQRPNDNLKIFLDSGFSILEHRGLEKTFLQSASTYSKLAQFGGRFEPFFKLMSIFDRKPWFYFYTGVIRITDGLLCPLLPLKWARIDLTVAQKD